MTRGLRSILALSFDRSATLAQEGTDAIIFYGGAGKGFRTMLDALIPAAEALEVCLLLKHRTGDDVVALVLTGVCTAPTPCKQAGSAASASEALAAAATAAKAGAEATKGMTARAGRSSYVRSSSAACHPRV